MTTYWIARNEGWIHLVVYEFQPIPHRDGWTCDGGACFEVPTRHWRFAGLPHEIAPGECWEVKREERWFNLHKEFADIVEVPIARNVTAELKEAARD